MLASRVGPFDTIVHVNQDFVDEREGYPGDRGDQTGQLLRRHGRVPDGSP